MNQRSSHFQLGNTPQNYWSVYGKDYTAKETVQNQVPVTNPFRGSSLKQEDRGSFATTNKTLLRAWDQTEVAKLDDQKLKELRSHHFKLGSYAPKESMTTNQTFHDRKTLNGEASKNQEESKNKMRGHNHNFKQQNFTNYHSAYAKQFTPKQSQPQVPIVTNNNEHPICFGNQPLPMLTTSALSYTAKEVVYAQRRPEATLGVKLGDKGEPMQTMNQLYFRQKEYSKAELPESTMKELRGTHFQMGQAQLQYQTESNNYRSTPTESKDNNLNFKIPTYESGTWNDKQAKFAATTTSKLQLPARQVKPFQRAVQAASNGIELGGHVGQYTSQFKGKFNAPTGATPNTLDISKKSNVVIGSGIGSYSTENKASYKPKDLNEGRCDVDIKKLSTEDHFNIGGTTADHKLTIYQDEHRKDFENRNRVFHKENK